MKNNIVEVKNLKKWFPITGGLLNKTRSYLKAVDDVSFKINKGETLGLVGESGCGKTTIGRTLIRLYNPTGGQFNYVSYEDGSEKIEDILSLPEKKLRGYRKDIQMIFQDPYASLNPRMTVQEIIDEGLKVHSVGNNRAGRTKIIADILEKVGLRPEYMKRYPHEFSGGQRQRIGIARAMVVNPKLVICDEPVSALDVSVQAQVINLLEDLKENFDLTYLFIAHDLSVVKHISNRITVMYLGKIMEVAETDNLFANPLHPYTKGLLSAIPVPNPHMRKMGKRELLTGDIPSPIDPPKACRFVKRCRYAMERCGKEIPVLRDVEPGHQVACFLYE